jgi:uncharacterized membrane protein YphA (DoxX/SURF4 family)
MTSKSKRSNTAKTINVILWIAQVILAVTFIWAGSMKLFKAASLPWPWVKEYPNLVRATGILDLLAGIGIILPALLRIRTQLTLYASYGIMVLMICAIIFHTSRGETSKIGINIFILFTALFVAWGRQRSTRYI